MKPYYEDTASGIVIFHGRCEEVLPTLTSIDLIVADLPYGTTNAGWDSVPEGIWKIFGSMNRPIIMTAAGSFTFSAVRECPVQFRHRWVWVRGNKATGHLDSARAPLRIFEDVLFFSNSAEYIFKPQKYPGPFTPATHGAKDRSSTLYGAHAVRKAYSAIDRFPRDVVCFPTVDSRQRQHPTEKPVALFDYLIRSYSNESAMVCDPTCGVGTSLLAAKESGRRAIGIEINEAYCEIAANRLRQEVLFGASA